MDAKDKEIKQRIMTLGEDFDNKTSRNEMLSLIGKFLHKGERDKRKKTGS